MYTLFNIWTSCVLVSQFLLVQKLTNEHTVSSLGYFTTSEFFQLSIWIILFQNMYYTENRLKNLRKICVEWRWDFYIVPINVGATFEGDLGSTKIGLKQNEEKTWLRSLSHFRKQNLEKPIQKKRVKTSWKKKERELMTTSSNIRHVLQWILHYWYTIGQFRWG